MKYITDFNKIKINTKEVKFPYEIREVKEINNTLIVRLEVVVKEIYNENVFCVSNEGNIIWQVQPYDFGSNDSPYTGITIIDSCLYLYNWGGFSVKVDAKTGAILNVDFVK
jgi:hypothetical protein